MDYRNREHTEKVKFMELHSKKENYKKYLCKNATNIKKLVENGLFVIV